MAHLVRKALLRVAAGVATSLAAAAVLLLIGPGTILSGGLTGVLGGCVAVLVVAGAAVAYLGWPAVERTSAGLRAERRAASGLRRSDAWFVMHGPVLGAGGDADHLVVGPGLAVVETKSGRGRVVRHHSGKVTVGRKTLRSDPFAQARRQAAALHKIAGVRTDVIVCVADMEGEPQHLDVGWVCSAADLPRVIQALDPVLARNAAEDLVRRVSSL